MRTTSASKVLCILLALTVLLTLASAVSAQKPKSPRTQASTDIGGKWITVDYSAPILRGRQGIFGSGDDYGTKVNAGGPVWRAGADATTELTTEVPLTIGGKTIQPGSYRLVVDLKSATEWELILTTKPAMATFEGRDKIGPKMWGAYGYSDDMDVARATMTVQPGAMSIDQLTYFFHDVSDAGGSLGLAWDTSIASVAFTVAK